MNLKDAELDKARNLFLKVRLSRAFKNKNQGFNWFVILSNES